MSYQPSILD